MLTTTQLQALKAHIEGDAILSAYPRNADGAFAVAQAMNQIAIPDFYVWRTAVTTQEVRSVLVWSEYDSLSASKQNAFAFLCSNHIVNAALPNVRQGIASIFAGPGQSGNLTALTNIAKRLATRAEKLFAVGTGSQSTPATSAFEDGFLLTYQDIIDAWNS